MKTKGNKKKIKSCKLMQIVRSYITNSNSYVISLIKIVFLAMEQLQCKQSTCDLGMKVIS